MRAGILGSQTNNSWIINYLDIELTLEHVQFYTKKEQKRNNIIKDSRSLRKFYVNC